MKKSYLFITFLIPITLYFSGIMSRADRMESSIDYKSLIIYSVLSNCA